MAKLVNLNQLAKFKQMQDAANSEKFLQVADFLDANGKISADKLATEQVVKIHVDSSSDGNKYFADLNGSKSTTEIVGEVGKIYIDLESGGRTIYTFCDGVFIPFVSEIATDSDIEKLFDD